MEILCRFRLALEQKTGKEIPEPSKIRVISKNFNNFVLSNAEDNTSGPLNRGGIADISVENTFM